MKPAKRAQSSGGLFRWKDGRDFPDLIETLYDYPKFRVVLRCNLNNAGGEPIKFHGTKGTMEIIGQTLTFIPQDVHSQAGRIFHEGLAGAASQGIFGAVGTPTIRSPARSTIRQSRPKPSPLRKATAMCPPIRQTFSMQSELASLRWRTKCSATMRPSDVTWPTTLTSRIRSRPGMSTQRRFDG